MSDKNNDVSKYLTARREIYASWLEFIAKTGLVLIVVSFTLYVFEIVQAYTGIKEISHYWSLSASEYMKQTGYHGGWAWTRLVHKSDFMNFVGISLLAGATVVWYVRVLPVFLKEKDSVLAWICVIQILVMTLAASGVLSAGH